MSAYTTIPKVEAYLLIDVKPDFEANVTRWIESISAYIEKATGRHFDAPVDEDDATVRKFDGTGHPDIVIDDCVEITKLETVIDGFADEIDATDFITYPANTSPITKISLLGGLFPRVRQCVHVTGRWGYSETAPADIEFAATVLLGGVINESNQHDGEITSETIGSYSVSYNTEQQRQDFDLAKKILTTYKRFTF